MNGSTLHKKHGRMRTLRLAPASALAVTLGLAIALLAAAAGLSAAAGFGAARPPVPDHDLLGRLRAAENTRAAALLVGADVDIGVEQPDEISLPVSVFALDPERPVTVRALAVAGPNGEIRATVRPNVRLAPPSPSTRTRADVLARLADRDHARASDILARGLAGGRIAVPVGDLRLKDGTTTTFTVSAVLNVRGEARTTTLELVATVAALPVASYWAGGDGHVHSSTWSDGWNSISTQVSDTKAAGHRWIIMTDHWKGIWAKLGRGNANWGLYQADCSAMETKYGIPVLPGTEVMSTDNQGHALAYALSPTKVPPRDEYFAPAALVTAIGDHTPGTSFSVIAHPYSALADAWGDWTATGFRALELMSQERQASPSTQERWFSLLRTGLAARIAGAPFVVGVANTDAHLLWQNPGDAGMTWVRSTATTLSRDDVWSAIRSGAASASGRGDLGYFSINGVQQGGIAAACSTTTLNFQIVQRPVTGRRCTEISIRDRNNALVWSVSNPSMSTYTKALPAPAADAFYVVKMVFAKTNDTDYSHVWCNPVFIDRR